MPRLPKNSPKDSDAAKEKIDSTLTNSSMGLDIPFHVRSFKSSNGDVDGELLLHGFRRDKRLKEYVEDMLYRFPHNLPGLWISVGVRYATAEGVKSADYRYKGLSEAMSNYRRADPTGILSAFLVEDKILDNLKAKHRSRPEQILIRLHWNEDNVKPGKMPERHRRTTKVPK